MKLPLKTLFYMLSYAGNMLDEADAIDLELSDDCGANDLLADILCGGIELLIRRGMSQSYLEYLEKTATPRGKIDFSATINSSALQVGQLICAVECLSLNSIKHQILKESLYLLCAKGLLSSKIRKRVEHVLHALSEVDRIMLSEQICLDALREPAQPIYRFLLEISFLIFVSSKVGDAGSEVKLVDFTQNDRLMRRVYEAFVRNFFRYETDFLIQGRQTPWQNLLARGSKADLKLFPKLEADIRLASKDGARRIIIETKYMWRHFQIYKEKKSFISAHLNQLFAYLANFQIQDPGPMYEGILLYPTNGEVSFNHSYNLHGFTLRIATVNLFQSPMEIEEELLGIANCEKSIRRVS
jgi:5-methylcytosine-specific restriction enzyme subunit McrC